MKEKHMLLFLFLYLKILAGKGFVESVKNKTDEQLDEEVKLENEPRKVCHFDFCEWKL